MDIKKSEVSTYLFPCHLGVNIECSIICGMVISGNSNVRSFKDEIYQLISPDDALLPNVSAPSDFELAYLEYKALSKNQLVERSGFFKQINGEITKHFELCQSTNKPVGVNRKYRGYFNSQRYSIGYATHGLFPYKGKFHPQLVRGIINSLRLGKESIILDPMCGSGTTNIEAALLGIDSYAIDVSPFCQFMTKTKYEALTLSPEAILGISNKSNVYFSIFSKLNPIKHFNEFLGEKALIQILILAYFDAIGFATRSPNLNLNTAYNIVLSRYERKLMNYLSHESTTKIGNLNILGRSKASDINLDSESIDAIITSPPYSDTLDYVSNDLPILKFFDTGHSELRDEVLGLRGESEASRIDNYIHDMDLVLNEYYRVLKDNGTLVLVIGFNQRQNKLYNLQVRIHDLFVKNHYTLLRKIERRINGLKNRMKTEEIIYLHK